MADVASADTADAVTVVADAADAADAVAVAAVATIVVADANYLLSPIRLRTKNPSGIYPKDFLIHI